MLEKQGDPGSDEPDSCTSQQWLEIKIEHKPIFDEYFSKIKTPIADYSFAACYIWKDAIELKWKIINNHLCVISTLHNKPSLMLPPLGNSTNYTSTLNELCTLCKPPSPLQVDYINPDFAPLFDFTTEMSGDYVYETSKMISLEGPELASKRQAKNRFLRRYSNIQTLPYDNSHFEDCKNLLSVWEQQSQSNEEHNIVDFKRARDVYATIEAMKSHKELNLQGMVLFAENKLIGFTFGEYLTKDTCNILIEKTDKTFAGSAAYIFSEFCRQYWSNTQFCNVGDDWEIPSLAYTKNSYNPAYRIKKYSAKIEELVYA